MGKLVKGHLAQQWGIDPASIYHCAVMPCYDKKLEASREDFYLPGWPVLYCAYCCLLFQSCWMLPPKTPAVHMHHRAHHRGAYQGILRF